MTTTSGAVIAEALENLRIYELKLQNLETTEYQSDYVNTLVQTNSPNEVNISDESIAFCVARSFL